MTYTDSRYPNGTLTTLGEAIAKCETLKELTLIPCYSSEAQDFMKMVDLISKSESITSLTLMKDFADLEYMENEDCRPIMFRDLQKFNFSSKLYKLAFMLGTWNKGSAPINPKAPIPILAHVQTLEILVIGYPTLALQYYKQFSDINRSEKSILSCLKINFVYDHEKDPATLESSKDEI